MELTELQNLINLLRANGITSYKNSDLELVLGAAPTSDVAEEQSRDELEAAERNRMFNSKIPQQYRGAFQRVGETS